MKNSRLKQLAQISASDSAKAPDGISGVTIGDLSKKNLQRALYIANGLLFEAKKEINELKKSQSSDSQQ